MPRCQQRLQIIGLCLASGLLASACDPKPTAPPTPKATTGASPTGIAPAASGDKVESSSSHQGPSEGSAAVGGMSGPGGGASGGAAPAPSGGDGTAPR
ncbi:hypothetical protein QMO14_03000 [Variovorax sp. CAN2819]|uniref:hypothetical protein n=1 Tax=Variovorax sp. CAN15 TaxID=3046727 RepID=UPI002648D4B7|nr:hypothetical protein [Variovorax sp. CAN15]MDN6882562.1 hypothetical protein [Variovorax sp. CAN15]